MRPIAHAWLRARASHYPRNRKQAASQHQFCQSWRPSEFPHSRFSGWCNALSRKCLAMEEHCWRGGGSPLRNGITGPDEDSAFELFNSSLIFAPCVPCFCGTKSQTHWPLSLCAFTSALQSMSSFTVGTNPAAIAKCNGVFPCCSLASILLLRTRRNSAIS